MKLISTAIVLLAAPCLAQDLAQDVEMTTVSYLCDRGARVEATYINSGEASYAVLGFEGRQVGLTIAVSASGARYVSADPAAPIAWWTKGETASLWAGPEATEVPIYTSCSELH